MIEYPKIETVFERSTEGSKKLLEGQYRDQSVWYLRNNSWYWTEKIDGTNISVEWDGHEVTFHGRTWKADIPKHLLTKLEEMFGGETNEEMFEQLFGDKHVILYGEGYGNKIQKVGSLYRDDCSFILFDIYLPEQDLWLQQPNCVEIAESLGIDYVPLQFIGTIEQAVAWVKEGKQSAIGTAPLEGLVGKPCGDFKDRQGKRIIVKVKTRDFE